MRGFNWTAGWNRLPVRFELVSDGELFDCGGSVAASKTKNSSPIDRSIRITKRKCKRGGVKVARWFELSCYFPSGSQLQPKDWFVTQS
jgi:hypothetical protein